MGRGLLLISAILVGLGLLFQFATVFDAYSNIDTNYIAPLTDNTTGYTDNEDNTVPNYNKFDYVIMHNFAYILYGGAVICVIVGLGQMRSGE